VTNEKQKFVGIQVGPINFVDEGVEPLLDMFAQRFGINALMVGTVSWLGLKVGRRVSKELEGWPDHGSQSDTPLRGGSYLTPHPEFYKNTLLTDFRARDEQLEGGPEEDDDVSRPPSGEHQCSI